MAVEVVTPVALEGGADPADFLHQVLDGLDFLGFFLGFLSRIGGRFLLRVFIIFDFFLDRLGLLSL